MNIPRRPLSFITLLQAPDLLSANLAETYAPFVTPDLLASWQKDPSLAPGRQTSSPWPERIDLLSLSAAPDGCYTVLGEIIEITSVEQQNGGIATRQLIRKGHSRPWRLAVSIF